MKTPVDTILSRLDRPVVIIGLMGAGKTRIGHMLARRLALPFVDADQEIERAAGCSVADIFERHGEEAFRDLERRVLSRLIDGDLKVISPGGGAVMDEDTAARVFGTALTVWLQADIDVLLERTGRSDKRPLLKGKDPRAVLQDLMKRRYPVYSRADIMIETNRAEADITLDNLLAAMAAYLERRAA